MIKCGVKKVYLFIILLFLGLYFWAMLHGYMTGTLKPGVVIVLTAIFSWSIYAALFQVKTVKIKDGLLTIFYPFRLWTKTYNLDTLEAWKYRKKTKTVRFEVYFRSRYVLLKFKHNVLLTVLFSLGLTNFDKLLEYLNEKHKDTRTNRISV